MNEKHNNLPPLFYPGMSDKITPAKGHGETIISDFERIYNKSMNKGRPPRGVMPLWRLLEIRVGVLVEAANRHLEYNAIKYIDRVADYLDEAIFLAEIYQEIRDDVPAEVEVEGVIELILERDKFRTTENTIESIEPRRDGTDYGRITDVEKWKEHLKSSDVAYSDEWERYHKPEDDNGMRKAVLRLRKR